MKYKKEIHIKKIGTDKIVKRIDVTDKSPRSIDRVQDGLNRNLDHENYYTVLWDNANDTESISGDYGYDGPDQYW